MARGPALVRSLVALLVSASAMAGCIGDDTPSGSNDPTSAPSTAIAPWAVIAIVDTGINPYHVDFRLPADMADIHPSNYIPGYPADIETVTLSRNATDLDAALEADAEVWGALEPETAYWFKGTKVTGIAFQPNDDPGPIFSTGHGSMTASKAAGVEYSLCPACHVVAVQGFNGASVVWASEQPWIDVQSDSWGPLPAFAWADRAPVPVFTDEPDLNAKFEQAAAQQAVFVSSGNGVGGALGVVGFPSPTDSSSGPPGVISVGGTDNGKMTLWTGWFPHVVADACDNWAVVGDSMTEYGDREGGGTSASSPYAAGGAARLILEARRILNATESRNITEGVYAKAPAGAALPTKGPLADGDLTLEELKHTLFHTASAIPQADEASGAECSAASPYHTTATWSTVPHPIPVYAWVGYGSVETASIAFGTAVLEGKQVALDRPQADDLYRHDQELRAAYHHLI